MPAWRRFSCLAVSCGYHQTTLFAVTDTCITPSSAFAACKSFLVTSVALKGMRRMLQEFQLPSCALWWVRFSCSATGRLLACGNCENQVHLWDPLGRPPAHQADPRGQPQAGEAAAAVLRPAKSGLKHENATVGFLSPAGWGPKCNASMFFDSLAKLLALTGCCWG
jgi:hypothetical protein